MITPGGAYEEAKVVLDKMPREPQPEEAPDDDPVACSRLQALESLYAVVERFAVESALGHDTDEIWEQVLNALGDVKDRDDAPDKEGE